MGDKECLTGYLKRKNKKWKSRRARKKFKEECAALEVKYVAEMTAAIIEIDKASKSVASTEDRKRLLKAVRRWRDPYDKEKMSFYQCYHYFPSEPFDRSRIAMSTQYMPPSGSEFWKLTYEIGRKTFEADKKLSESYGPVAKGFRLMTDEESTDGLFRETIFYQKRASGILQKHCTTITKKDGTQDFAMNVVFIK